MIESNAIMNAIHEMIAATNYSDLGLTLDLHVHQLGGSALMQIAKCPMTLSRLEVLKLSGTASQMLLGGNWQLSLRKAKVQISAIQLFLPMFFWLREYTITSTLDWSYCRVVLGMLNDSLRTSNLLYVSSLLVQPVTEIEMRNKLLHKCCLMFYCTIW